MRALTFPRVLMAPPLQPNRSGPAAAQTPCPLAAPTPPCSTPSLPTPTAGDGPCPPWSGRHFSLLTVPLRDDATWYGLTRPPRQKPLGEARINMCPFPRTSTQCALCLPGPSLVPAHTRVASLGDFEARVPEESLVPTWGARQGLVWPAAAEGGRSDLQLPRPRGPASEEPTPGEQPRTLAVCTRVWGRKAMP